MPVSLNNRRNTRIVETWQDHPERSTKVRQFTRLEHHGVTTCSIQYDSHGHLFAVHIDTHGHNTATTRGKINLFLAKFARQLNVKVYCKRGQLRIRSFAFGTIEDAEFSRYYSITGLAA